jgi:cell division protein FtsX
MKLHKHTRILEFALSSLLRQKFKNMAIFLVYSLVVFLVSSVLLLTQALRKEAVELLIESPELIVQRMRGGRHELIPLKYGEVIRGIRGVREVIPRYWGYYFDPPINTNYTFLGADEMPSNIATMIDGSFLEKGARRVCVIGEGVSDLRFVGLDDIIPIKKSDGELYVLRVVGIFHAESNILTNDLVIISVHDLKSIFGIPDDMSTDMVVRVRNPNEVSTIARKIQEKLPDTRPIEKEQILRTYEALFSWRSGLLIAILIGSIAAFFILTWNKASGLSAEERKEIGILKAIGWDTSDVLELKFWEGFVISILSFLTGVIAAYVHLLLFGGSLFSPVLKGWSILFPELRLAPFMDIYQLFVIMLLSVIPYISATILPSWKAAITDPDMVMRE